MKKVDKFGKLKRNYPWISAANKYCSSVGHHEKKKKKTTGQIKFSAVTI